MIKITTYNSDGSIRLQSIQGGSQWIEDNVSSQADGSNLVFVASKNFVSNTVEVFLNGMRLIAPDDYTITGANQITMVTAPLVNDKVILKYVVAG